MLSHARNHRLITDLATKHRLLTRYASAEFAGGVVAYGVNYPDMYRRVASFADKIPVEEASILFCAVPIEVQQENGMSRTTAHGLASLLTLWALASADLAAVLRAPP